MACRNEEMFEDIILDMIGCGDLDDRWKDKQEKAELVDEILEANK